MQGFMVYKPPLFLSPHMQSMTKLMEHFVSHRLTRQCTSHSKRPGPVSIEHKAQAISITSSKTLTQNAV